MATETAPATYPHVTLIDGQWRLKENPRWRIVTLVELFRASGVSMEEFCAARPGLTPAEAYAGMAYYHDHKEELDQVMRAEEEECERGRAAAESSPLSQKLRAIAEGLRCL